LVKTNVLLYDCISGSIAAQRHPHDLNMLSSSKMRARGSTHVMCFSDLPNSGKKKKFTSHLIFSLEHIYIIGYLIHFHLLQSINLFFRPITYYNRS